MRRMNNRGKVRLLRNMMMITELWRCIIAAVEDMKVGDSERVSRAQFRNGQGL